MSDSPSRDEINQRFDDLRLFLGVKLDAIIARQDVTNGRLDKVESRVDAHDLTFTRVKAIWGAGAIGVGAFGHQLIDAVKKWLTN